MASFIGWHETNAMIAQSVVFHGVFIRTCPLKRVIEMHGWLEEPSRPGYYTIANVGDDGGTWTFTDKDVAFEFKMRWV